MTAAFIYQALSEFADDLTNDWHECEDLTDEQLVLMMVAIRNCRQDLASLYDEMEQMLLSLNSGREITIEGVGVVELKRSTKRTNWDNHELMRHVVSRALDERQVNEETGEAEPGWEAVARAIEECARPSWRLTPLRARGLDPDEFCVTEEAHRSVQLPPRQR